MKISNSKTTIWLRIYLRADRIRAWFYRALIISSVDIGELRRNSYSFERVHFFTSSKSKCIVFDWYEFSIFHHYIIVCMVIALVETFIIIIYFYQSRFMFVFWWTSRLLESCIAVSEKYRVSSPSVVTFLAPFLIFIEPLIFDTPIQLYRNIASSLSERIIPTLLMIITEDNLFI